MPNDFFHFKQFTIYQDHCAMKVGTDGVLLGAWTHVEQAKRILDIGTGTGLIALMLAQRSSAEIDAIEIDSDAASQARENVQRSPWSHRIHVLHTSLQDYLKEKKKYDLIVANPPYFTDSLKTPDNRRSLARHNHELSQVLLIEGIQALLETGGRFNVILPASNFESFSAMMNEFHWVVSRQTNVFSKPDSTCIRILAEFSDNVSTGNIDDLVVETHGRHEYSIQYIELIKDYFLKF